MQFSLFKIYCILFLVLSSFGKSQINDSMSVIKEPAFIDTLPNSLYISTGVGVVSNYNGNFIEFLYNHTSNLQPQSPSTKIKPDYFDYENVTKSFSIFGGLELVSEQHTWMHHQLEIGCIQTQGSYGYSVGFTYTTTSQGNTTQTTIHDDVRAQYTQGIFIMGYKFQPSTKHFFASIGVNAFMNFMRIKEQVLEQKDVFTSSGNSTISTIDKSTSYNFTNLPIQIGGGVIYRQKEFSLNRLFMSPPALP